MNYWKNENRRLMLGGNLYYGAGAGLSFLTLGSGLSYSDQPISCLVVLPRPVPEYPAYIPKRWIHLAKYAKKARTRKKWKHTIERKIRQHEKRKPKERKHEKRDFI